MSDLRILTIDELSQIQDIATDIVPTPEWGEGTGVKIQGLTKAAQNRVRGKAIRNGKPDQDRIDMYTLLEGIVDPPLEEKHFTILRQKQAGVLDRILLAICKLSGINTDATLSAEAVEEAESAFRE